MAYDDQRYFTQQVINLGNEDKAQTSVIAANTEHERFTAMCNITVKDFNVFVVDGHTTTGAAATTAFKICLAKSAAGTGALSAIGTAAFGTQANGTVLDSSCTETDLDTGDDLVLYAAAGTALPAGMVKFKANVLYVDRFV